MAEINYPIVVLEFNEDGLYYHYSFYEIDALKNTINDTEGNYLSSGDIPALLSGATVYGGLNGHRTWQAKLIVNEKELEEIFKLLGDNYEEVFYNNADIERNADIDLVTYHGLDYPYAPSGISNDELLDIAFNDFSKSGTEYCDIVEDNLCSAENCNESVLEAGLEINSPFYKDNYPSLSHIELPFV